ncbi:MutS-related protein [Adhaeretor mobilis]|uniref:Endonuclease MutS2 n=1 Tax=Adhaeretor mobilis TaxID=1930276 RepID=A0A517N230_9BACT|nr:DNA mismatch repair protein MutS [Adhaeretor mobilis]QDT01181.1 Endonuclease MutS2 [Adhaeretor mobilis]
MDCRSEYEKRLQARQQAYASLRRKDDQAVSLRTALLCAALLATWVVFGGWGVPWQFLLFPIGIFIGTVFYHGSIKRKLLVATRAIEHYQRCLKRLDGKWVGIGPDGEEFIDPLHPYSGDLDIFGHGSLFQLLNSPVTPAGEKTLASWLAPEANKALPSKETILDRQKAVHNLRDQLDLRERLAIIGPTKQSQQDAMQLQKWLANPGELTATWVSAVGLLLGVMGVLALGHFFVTIAMGTVSTSKSLSLLILVVLLQMGFLYHLRATLLAIKQYSEHAVLELQRIVRVVSALETVRGDDPAIKRLRHELVEDGTPTSQKIHQLERTVSQFDNMCRNAMIAPLALISMVGLHFACKIDHWRSMHGSHVARWFDAAGELEALLAFAQLHFENSEYCFPQIEEGAPQFTAHGLSHPLLPSAAAVANDVALGEGCRLLLISGSNMSGKSTLMRSVGINTALAWSGAPVFARELKLSRLQVAAAMRVQDSLQTGTSHFFAELKRIQLIVELAEDKLNEAQKVLFLLDEILHGTNSHDRLVGARAVIHSLLKSGSVGLVTTHDLSLSEIVNEQELPAKNVHFRDESVDGKMTFDYKMRTGVVPKSNALTLMRLLGLDV